MANNASLKEAFAQMGPRMLVPGFESLAYNPSNEWLFPSPILAEGRFKNPQGKWAMYYAPHESPGGVCLAWADELTGPWREHSENPVISNVWEPHYRVGHISSPHPLWHEEEQRLFVWYHGENNTTRLATSEDGIYFEYANSTLTAADFGRSDKTPDVCFYARVFAWNGLPDGDRYVFLALTAGAVIVVATSPDARTWKTRKEPLLHSPEGRVACAPFLFDAGEKCYLLYHCDIHNGPGDIMMAEVSRDLRTVGEPEVVFPALPGEPDNTRVGDPYLVEDNGRLHLFYCAGERLKGKHAMASAPWPSC